MKNVKKYLYFLPMLIITAAALIALIIAFVSLVFTVNREIFDWSMVTIFFLPIILVLTMIRIFLKIRKYSGVFKYGIRFWPAIMYAPRGATLGIYGFSFLFIVSLVITAITKIDEFALSCGLILFYYISFVVFWSGFRESRQL